MSVTLNLNDIAYIFLTAFCSSLKILTILCVCFPWLKWKFIFEINPKNGDTENGENTLQK